MKWLVVLLLTGCGGTGASGLLDSFAPADLNPNDPEAVRDAAQLSAPNVFFQALLPMFLSSSSEDRSCPRQTSDGIEGGCTDARGTEWVGRVRGAAPLPGTTPSGTIRFDGFGMVGSSTCAGSSGRTEVTFDGSVSFGQGGAFDIDMVVRGSGPDEDCDERAGELAFEYAGRMEDQGSREIWSGSGRVGSEIGGVLEATTENEVRDDSVCSSEAASGRTIVKTRSGDAIFTYDGATDCDPEGTVRWSFAGADRGELSGVACTGVCSGTGGVTSLLLLAGALLFLRKLRP